jgi:hypothetical protein
LPDAPTVDNGASEGGGSLACKGPLGGLAPLLEGDHLGATTLADLNRDGKLDAVAMLGEVVRVRLGKGDGTFAAAVDYDVDQQNIGLWLGDLDNDGSLDIVTSGYVARRANILLGRGDGTFSSAPDVTIAGAGYAGTAVALADVNGDGKLDLLSTDFGADAVWVLPGRGDGTFAAQQTYSTGDGPDAVLAGDMNNDGKLDIVVVNHCSKWADVLLNRGDGTFANKQEAPVASSGECSLTLSTALGDVNNDGKLDLVVAGFDPGTVSILLGGGDGTFAQPRSLPAPNYLQALSLVDLNADGKLDLVVEENDVRVSLGYGDGTFATPTIYPVGSDLTGVLPGDLDGDGRMDLLLSLSGRGGSMGEIVWFGRGDGTFVSYPTYPVGGPPLSLALGDVNADGRPDLVTASQSTSTVSVLLGNRDGTFAPRRDFATGQSPRRVALGDMNGDHRLDIVTAAAAAVSVLLGAGDGTFGTKADYPGGSGPGEIALGDLNRDGTLDVVSLGTNDFTGKGTLSVLLGIGAGVLAAPVDYPLGSSSNPQSVALGDLNGDGTLDVVVGNAGYDGGWSVDVLFGKGDGTLADVVVVSASRASTVALGDLNRDGKLDIVAGDDWDQRFAVLLGKGDGTFADPLSTTIFDGPAALHVTDWDGDGVPDVLVAAATTSVLFGKGDGTFAGRAAFSVSSPPFAVGDVNADGRPDLVTSTGSASVGVLLNLCR